MRWFYKLSAFIDRKTSRFVRSEKRNTTFKKQTSKNIQNKIERSINVVTGSVKFSPL